ncbi:MAG: CoA transferase subunit A, partial [Chloroflexi bacterium]|nr:CoA transferase subunit A [Chloroflexota bacterium]
SPSAAVHELVRQRKRDLTLIKTAGGYDVDLLVGAGCVSRLIVAYVGFENLQGMAPRFRRAVEEGRVALEEQTCTSVITGLRAASQGIPFMPIAGMAGSDIVPGRFLSVPNPYGEGEVVTVPAIWPDWAIVHVQEADPAGNARIHGTQFEDVLMAKAARRVMVICERIVGGEEFAAQPELTAIPAFQVDVVVEAPHGAWPASCAGHYGVDEGYLAAYYQAALKATPEGLEAFLRERGALQPVPAGAAG